MTVGETLLKITDFPFAYSMVVIIATSSNIDMQNGHLLILLSVAGAFGTFLTITDPLGRLFRFLLLGQIDKRIKQVKEKNQFLFSKLNYGKGAIHSRAISIEIDKLVGVSYFVILLLIYNTLIVYSAGFVESLVLKDKNGNTICDTSCVRTMGDIFSFGAVIPVVIIASRTWRDMKNNIETVAIYQLGISSEDSTRSTIENLSNAIEQNDWSTAKEWASIVEKEIQTKKGSKEILLKLTDVVYEPLYQECKTIEYAYNNTQKVKNFIPFSHIAWDKVKDEPMFLTLTDESIRKELESFYSIISEYNQLEAITRRSAEEIIRRKITEFYGGQIADVLFFVDTGGSRSAPSLWDCAIIGIHPAERLGSSTPVFIQVSSSHTGRTESRQNEEDFKFFNRFWEAVLHDIHDDLNISRRRELFDIIADRNNTVKNKLLDAIKFALKA